jgi:4-amino-4-deoxy-L-arabinose transferase-like glycosyltransferase
MSESKPLEKDAKDDARKRAIDAAFDDGSPMKKGEEAVDANGVVKTEAPSPAQAAVSGEEKEEKKDEETPDIVPRGNPLRIRRGVIGILAGGIPAFLLMAKNGQNAWGVPVGILCILGVAWGVMDLLGTFDDPDDRVAAKTTLGDLAIPLARMIGLLVAFAGALAVAQAGFFHKLVWAAPLLVTATFLGLVVTIFDVGRALGPWRTDELGLERPIWQRHGFWVIAVGAILYFPTLGLHSLWDPWETHYGEVAREILARDDWVSLWWAQDGWFWSKPILNFWIQAIAMASLGTHFRSDQMLVTDAGPLAHPEWVVRTPNVLMTLVAMYLLYKGVAKVFGRRAGLLGAVVLATMPDWFFLAHQTMTDMPFVAAMTAAMGLLLFGLNTEEEKLARVWEVEAFGVKWRLSLWHLVFGAVLLCAVPQILYLLSRNLELVVFGDGPHGFRIHWDEFKSGSAINCGLPGNESCVTHSPASVPKSVGATPDGLWPSLQRYFGGFEPSLQAVGWGVVLGGTLWLNWGERRVRRLVYIAAWLCAAIATMAKGPAGFGLPIICAFAYVATKKRWGELLRLEMMSGILIILGVAIPWYVAMYVRHGSPFTDRLIFHDMFNRAFSHVHDTNEGDDTGLRFYIWQLGYALFPWTGLAPLGLLWGFRKSDSAQKTKMATGDASVMLVMWFLFAFALFTFMGTKFHHYIFPAVPPIAMLLGVVLDDVLGERPLVQRGLLPAYLGGLGVAAAIATWGASRLWTGSITGTPDKEPSSFVTTWIYAPNAWEAAVLVGAGIAVAASAVWWCRDRLAPEAARLVVDPGKSPYRGGAATAAEDAEDVRARGHEAVMVAGSAIVAALVCVLVGRDLAIKPDGSDQPGAIRLLHLFTYNYRRPWPETVDFKAILAGFTIVAAIAAAALAVERIRRHAVIAFCAFAFVWALWGVDVYMKVMSPHWGQHEVIEAYYRDRKGPEEILVAYQMNWKGENFYTGNHVPAFVSSGATFQNWLKTQREKGVKVMYFVTEHGRTGGLRSEVGAKSYRELTDKALNNKFVLVRAEL